MTCKLCDGTGFVTEERDGALYARRCQCTDSELSTQLILKAEIPQRYRERYVFSLYNPVPGTTQSDALMIARRYADEYPAVPEGQNGLLMLGACGVGKTHLMVAILQEILFKKGMPALYADLNAVYREIWASYGRQAGESEYDIMAPLVDAPLLLLDELGCISSPWAQDTLHFLISRRYSDQRPTLLTSNYCDEPPSGEPSLEDRIGTRTRSRLHEMCKTIKVDGPDYRRRQR